MVDVVFLIKVKFVIDVSKYFRLILFIFVLFKIVEEFIVVMYIGLVILLIIDFDQFGVIFKLFIIYVFILMVYKWFEVIDVIGVVVRIVFLDYRKVFDLIDYCILV